MKMSEIRAAKISSVKRVKYRIRQLASVDRQNQEESCRPQPTHAYDGRNGSPKSAHSRYRMAVNTSSGPVPPRMTSGWPEMRAKTTPQHSRRDDHFHGTDLALRLHGHDTAERHRGCQTREEKKQRRTDALGVQSIAKITEVIRPTTSHSPAAIHRRTGPCRSGLRPSFCCSMSCFGVVRAVKSLQCRQKILVRPRNSRVVTKFLVRHQPGDGGQRIEMLGGRALWPQQGRR